MSSSSRKLDRLEATFDHDGLVANAGLIVPATLMSRLGIEALIDTWVRTGSALPGRKVLTLVAAMIAHTMWAITELTGSDSSGCWKMLYQNQHLPNPGALSRRYATHLSDHQAVQPRSTRGVETLPLRASEIVPELVEVEGWWSPPGRCLSGIVREFIPLKS